MASYYYLISSLPTLKTDSPMPFDYNAFLKMCENSVPEDVFFKLKNLTLNSDEGKLVKQWGEFYNKMMASLNKQRNLKLGKNDIKETDKDFLIDKAVDSAINAENPLIAEKILLNCQFEYLDSLVQMHYFDDYVLFGYAVKLKLLERQNIFEQKLGKQEFARLFDGIQVQIAGI